MKFHLFLIIFFLLGVTHGEDVFRFAHHYADNMVLQRAPLNAVVWGYREDQQPVNVLIRGPNMIKHETVEVTGNQTVWRAVLPPIHADGTALSIEAFSIVGNKHVTISINNVLFGDVWLCGGQSNMEFSTIQAFKGKREIQLADKYPQIRLFTVKQYSSNTPVHEMDPTNIVQRWQVASAKSVGGPSWKYFSAVCWMFGRRLHDVLGIPIGLIASNWGGTPVEAWSSPEALAECYSDQVRLRPLQKTKYHKRRQRKMQKRNRPIGGPQTPSILWNSMISPLINMTMWGAIWYQGENNSPKPDKYNCTFPAMIRDWRRKWFSGTGGHMKVEFPFGFVQLSTLGLKYSPQQKKGFPIIRWKQTAEYGYVPNPKMPKTFMAVALDLPDNTSPYGGIHPRDKTDVADRLVLGAVDIAYDTHILWTGPIFSGWNVTVLGENYQRVNITFKQESIHPTLGIEIRDQNGFEVLVAVHPHPPVWQPVTLTVWKGNWVSSTFLLDSTSLVLGVRYNWDQQPCRFKSCAVYSDNLPAPPFIHVKS